MKDKKEYIVLNEGVWRSVLKDSYTFGLMFGLLLFNHQLLSGSGWLDILFVLLILVFVLGRNTKSIHRFNSKKETIDWLEENKNEKM
jgi:hypothetical protein